MSLIVMLASPHSGLKENEMDARFTGPCARARPFARLLAPLRQSLAPHCLLHSRAPLHLLAASLTHWRAYGKDINVYQLNASISFSFNPLCIVRVRVSPAKLGRNSPNPKIPAPKADSRRESRKNWRRSRKLGRRRRTEKTTRARPTTSRRCNWARRPVYRRRVLYGSNKSNAEVGL